MGAKYGQHFLSNRHAAERIVTALNVNENDAIFEIGPGKGALTSLLIPARKVVVVEIDPTMAGYLRQRFTTFPQIEVIEQDILKFDMNQLNQKADCVYKVVGNLPYNLTSPILRKLSEWSGWQFALVMVQKEVGDRLSAKPGSGEYGALTVGMNLTCAIEPVFDLSETSFSPAPKVRSSVVKLIRRPQPLTDDIEGTQRVIQAAFQQRRKTILNSLSHGLQVEKAVAENILNKCHLDPGIRPERISVEEFIRLSREIKPFLS